MPLTSDKPITRRVWVTRKFISIVCMSVHVFVYVRVCMCIYVCLSNDIAMLFFPWSFKSTILLSYVVIGFALARYIFFVIFLIQTK